LGTVTELGTFDVLSDALQSLGLQTRLFCHSELASPWCLAFPASQLAHFHYIERGGAWVRLYDSNETIALAAGELLVLPHGKRYQIADTPKRTPIPFSRVIPPSPRGCSVVHSGEGVPAISMLCGAFSMQHASAHPLLSLLPETLLLRPSDSSEAAWVEATLRQLATEVRRQQAGHELVVNRLTDVLFVQVLRAWLSQSPTAEGNWLGALRDPHIGKALALMHADAANDWTIQDLADRAGLSRSPFAARFVRLVGESPIAYLTKLRMRKAASMLRSQMVSMMDAALASGYQSEAAFSKAFRRQFGVPPGKYRRAV
jgi:AraC-like DNA-binding protein